MSIAFTLAFPEFGEVPISEGVGAVVALTPPLRGRRRRSDAHLYDVDRLLRRLLRLLPFLVAVPDFFRAPSLLLRPCLPLFPYGAAPFTVTRRGTPAK